MLRSPADLDNAVAAFATGGYYSRGGLTELTHHALMPEARQQLARPDATPAAVADTVLAAGCSPATAVLVLAAERFPAKEVAPVLPTAGVPIPHAIRALHHHWDMPRHQAAQALGATATEMRSAGCTAAEVMAAQPRDVLRALPDNPEAWTLAALTMADGGHPLPTIASHLVAHAPSPDTFALALNAVEDDPAAGIAAAVRYGAQGDHLAAATEAYGLSPAQAATALVDAGATRQVTVDALAVRCDHDPELVARHAGPALGLDADQVADLLAPSPPGELIPMPTHDSPDPTDTASLLAHLPDPEPATDLTPDALLSLLPEPDTAVQHPDTPETTR